MGMMGDAFEQKRVGSQLVDAETVGNSAFILSLENCIRVEFLRSIELLRCEREQVEIGDCGARASSSVGVSASRTFIDVGVGELERFDRSGSVTSG
jgi:hypothetical protein